MRGRLFERFATGQTRGGTGLGLYIVRQLARAHDGDATYRPARAGPGRARRVRDAALPRVRDSDTLSR